MYKIFTGIICGSTSCALSKFLRVMKLTIVLWVVAFMQVSASTYAQKTSLNVKNKPLIDVLDQITRQTNYNFIYNSDILNTAKPVSISVKDGELNDVLKKCFFDQPFTYVINGNTVIIKRKPEVVALSAVQAIPIKGTVTDDKGVPLAGASVMVKDAKKGAVTNNAGEFSIDAKPGDILIISYIGFQTQEIVIGSQSSIDVRMTAAINALNELVVIGYGTQKQSNITGAISSIKASDMKDQQITRLDNALQGRVAGVSVIQSSGAPGSGPTINVRGVTSINNSNPLYVIDGVVVDNGGIDNINPNDIASIDVLKDAAAAIYGSRASAGVILVTTKKGKPGAPVITYDGYYGLQNPIKKVQMADGTQYATLRNEAITNDGGTAPFADPSVYGTGTNWQNVVFGKNVPIQNHNISVSGGNDKNTYSAHLRRYGTAPILKWVPT